MEALDAEVVRLLHRKGVPALAAAVYRGEELLLERAWGAADIASRVPASSEHVFQMCSVTKMFTATAVLQLVERGVLRLDEPLRRYLPVPEPGWERVTARHLLSHHAGLKDPLRAAPILRPGEKPPTARELVDRAGVSHPFPRPPGRGSYANVHYMVLAWLVEAVAQVPLAEYVEREILDPMDLADLAYGYPERFLPRAARGYIGAVLERTLLRILAGAQASALEGPRTGWVVAIEPYRARLVAGCGRSRRLCGALGPRARVYRHSAD